MKTLYALVLLSMVFAVAISKFHEHTPFITKEFVDSHKQSATFETYSFEEHPFKGWTRKQVNKLLGAKLTSPIKTLPEGDLRALPDNFDARDQWKNCVLPVRNQGQCGSCWAFAASEVLSNRLCIASGGSVMANLSPQDLVSCDYLDLGCDGGILLMSWITLRFKGITTESCFPYQSGKGNVPWCPFFNAKCADGNPWKKYYASNFYLFSSLQQIKENIFSKGPIEAGFEVYADFMNYKSGIYVRHSDELLGGHAVKTVGWGTLNGVNYWVVQNSWGPSWGENGYFRIKIGECGFESQMIAGDPYL